MRCCRVLTSARLREGQSLNCTTACSEGAAVIQRVHETILTCMKSLLWQSMWPCWPAAYQQLG